MRLACGVWQGELAALREGEKSIAAQELQLQARLEEVLAREESMRDRERDVEEQARSMEEVTAARERVLRARELLLQQGEKTRKQEALRLADSQRQLGPVQVRDRDGTRLLRGGCDDVRSPPHAVHLAAVAAPARHVCGVDGGGAAGREGGPAGAR